MSTTIPFIRGFALFPALSWFARHGIPVEAALEAAKLPRDMVTFPCRPVPLVQAATLLRVSARQVGPDLPYRIVRKPTIWRSPCWVAWDWGQERRVRRWPASSQLCPFTARTSMSQCRRIQAQRLSASSSPTNSIRRLLISFFNTPQR